MGPSTAWTTGLGKTGVSQSRPFLEAGLGWDHWARLGLKGRSGVTEHYLYRRQPSTCTSEVYLWDEVPWQAQVWPSF